MGTNVLEELAASVLYLKTEATGTTYQARGSHYQEANNLGLEIILTNW
jgi:hypothetical protein